MNTDFEELELDVTKLNLSHPNDSNIFHFRTDTFSVRNTGTGVAQPPTICGTNTNEHSNFISNKFLLHYEVLIFQKLKVFYQFSSIFLIF